jgi:hypothetical protein
LNPPQMISLDHICVEKREKLPRKYKEELNIVNLINRIICV